MNRHALVASVVLAGIAISLFLGVGNGATSTVKAAEPYFNRSVQTPADSAGSIESLTTQPAEIFPVERAAANSGVQTILSDDKHLIIEIDTGDYEFVNATSTEGLCQRLISPGYETIGQPGWPALPALSTMIGIPVNSQPNVHILSSETIEIDGALISAPNQRQLLTIPPSITPLKQSTG